MAETPKVFRITVYKEPTEAERNSGKVTHVVDTACEIIPGGVLFMASKDDADRLALQLRQVGVNAYADERSILTRKDWMELYADKLVEAAYARGKAAGIEQAAKDAAKAAKGRVETPA